MREKIQSQMGTTTTLLLTDHIYLIDGIAFN